MNSINEISSKLDSFTICACEAAAKAGEYSLPYFGRPARIDEKTHSSDIVTEADIESERIIKDYISTRFDGHYFFAEESADIQNKNKDFLWVIDPIDGTTNFAHGYLHYSVSIALYYKGQAAAAAVFAPVSGDMYYANALSPAYKNNLRISVSKTEKLEKSLCITGFYYNDRKDGAGGNLSRIEKALKLSRGVRRSGSSVMDLCQIAAGAAEAYWEQSLQAWDIAAGRLIVERAGGSVISVNDGKPYDIFSRSSMLASNSLVEGEVLQRIFGS